MTKISVGADHAGFALKQEIVKFLKSLGHEVHDQGCHSEDRVDYPDFAALVARDVQSGKSERGILVCGTGIGVSIAANKFKGIRAASIWSVEASEMSRKHNDLNVLCLGGRVLDVKTAQAITKTFLETEFEGGRHGDRLKKISALE